MRTPSFSLASPAVTTSLLTASKSPLLSHLPYNRVIHLATNALMGRPGGDGKGEVDVAIDKRIVSRVDICGFMSSYMAEALLGFTMRF